MPENLTTLALADLACKVEWSEENLKDAQQRAKELRKRIKLLQRTMVGVSFGTIEVVRYDSGIADYVYRKKEEAPCQP